MTDPLIAANRRPDPRVVPLMVERWSPRAFDGSTISDADLQVIFEAAGWAPSSYNYQPWRFLYARRDDANWQRFLDLLVPFNAGWAKDAAVLIYFVSDTMTGEGDEAKPSHTHSYDTGAAWMQMALQASALGYHSHGMIGFDIDRAQVELKVPARFRIDAATVIGRRAPKERLSEQLQEREVPSTRKPVSEIAIAGDFV